MVSCLFLPLILDANELMIEVCLCLTMMMMMMIMTMII